MKKIIIPVLVLIVTTAVQADVIKCTFTEPFVSSTYNMSTKSLTYVAAFGADGKENETTVLEGVSFQIKDAGHFELISSYGDVLQVISLNHAGSDGMSDMVYPYEVKDSSSMFKASAGIGACTSNYLKAKSND
jgi:hypothetical protein